jgi:hypothetical protein
VRSACTAVAALNPEWLTEHAADIAGGATRGDELVPKFLSVADDAFGALIGRNPHQARGTGDGKPKGAVKDWSFQELVRDLWNGVNAYGGKLTLSENGGKAAGTVVAALRLLRPHVPLSFPESPPYKILREIQVSLRPARRET